MPGLNFGLARSSSIRTAETQVTVASPTVKVKAPYWAGTEQEVQAQAAPSRAGSRRIARKAIATSTATTPTTPVSTAPSPAPAQPYTCEPVAGSLYLDPTDAAAIQQWQEKVKAASSARKPLPKPRRDNSPPTISGEEVARPLSPGSIFANDGTPPAPSATRKASLAISRGIGSLRKASLTVKQALTSQHEPKISSPVPGSFQRGIPAGHVLEPQDNVAPLDLVGLEAAQADVSRYGQADFKIAAAQDAAAAAQASTAVATALDMLTGGESAAPQSASSPAPATTTPVPPAGVTRKVVNYTNRETAFGDIIAAAQDDSWVQKTQSQVQAEAMAESQARADTKGKGGVSSPRAPATTSTPTNRSPARQYSFSSMNPEALNVRKQPNVNTNLPSTPVIPVPARSAQRASRATPRPLHPTPLPVRLQVPRPASPVATSSGLAAALGAHHASFVPGVTCTQCGKIIDVVAVHDHRCGKKSAV